MAVAVITGASSWIGREFALLHAKAGDDVVLIARRETLLYALKEEIEKKYTSTVYVISVDLASQEGIQMVRDFLREKALVVDYLINNAWFGGYGLFAERSRDDESMMIDVNIKALTALTKALLPSMITKKSGKILNVWSIASFVPWPLQAVYFATKAYVLSLSVALANETKGTGVTVTCLCPGVTETGFIHQAGLEWSRMSRGHLDRADVVALKGYRGMLRGASVVIYGAGNRWLVRVLTPLLPRSRVAAIARRYNEK